MYISEVLNKYINELDQQRLVLYEKYKRSIKWHLFMPVLVALGAFLITKQPQALAIGAVASAVFSGVLYAIYIGVPFGKIKAKLKTSVLQDLMMTFHPDVDFSYTDSKQEVRSIARDSGFFSANRYHEEDVIRGQYGDVRFYISEIKLSRKQKKSRVTVFDGLLFKINIPGKSFPKSRIQSRPGLLTKIFRGYDENSEFGFHYDTENEQSFQELLGPLFPFLRHLIQTNRDLRINIEGDEIVMFLNSDMDFLDDPKPRLKSSLLSNRYVENLAQQLNSLLFIVETLANDLDSEAIEERLELKVLQYAENKGLNN